jgi:phosphoserine phosphatase RsbU/P
VDNLTTRGGVFMANSKILIVDDVLADLRVLSDLLEPDGYNILVAPDGEVCLKIAVRMQPSLILLDIKMPGLDGFETCKKLKEDPKTADIPVIFVTAIGETQSIVKGFNVGGVDYITKPFEQAEVIVRVRNHLEIKQHHDELQHANERLKNENKRKTEELERARMIQQAFLPDNIPVLPHIEIARFHNPSTEVGGDYYDLIELSSGKLGIAIGDVCGKGMPASLLMANLQASLRRCSEIENSPKGVINWINKSLCPICQHIDGHRFITLFYGVLDPLTKTLVYCNAGHNYPFVFRNNGCVWLDLESSGLPCGIMEHGYCEDMQIVLESADILVLYTDGLTEAMNPDEEVYGEDRLKNLIMKNYYLCASDIIDVIERDLVTFIGDAIQHDDITLVIIKMGH